MADRKPREQVELEALLRFKRAWDKKKDDIRWFYEEFLPTVEDYKAGRIKLNHKKRELDV